LGGEGRTTVTKKKIKKEEASDTNFTAPEKCIDANPK